MIANWSLFWWSLGIFAATCALPFMARAWDEKERIVPMTVDIFGSVLAIVLMIQAIELVNVWVDAFVVLFVFITGSWVSFKLGYDGYQMRKEKEEDAASGTSVPGDGT